MSPYAAPPWTQPFLDRLAACGVIARACRESGAPYATVMQRKARDADFAAAVEAALEESYDTLEAEARRRALDGVQEPIVHQGRVSFVRDSEGELVLGPDGLPQVLTQTRHSDALMQFLLKGYRRRFGTDRTELTGADGAPVQLDDTARAARVAQLVALAQARAAEHTAIDKDSIA